MSLDKLLKSGKSAMAKWLLLLSAIALISGCKNETVPATSEEQTLKSQYGRKKIYLWSKNIKSSRDKINRTCWYYKEASPSLGLSEQQAIASSSQLNEFAIPEVHIQDQLQNILKEKMINAGAEFVPCGLATVSVSAAVATGGASAIAFGVSSAWMVNNCIKNSINISRYIREFRASSDGIASLENGETNRGNIFAASKTETDMLREAVRRARQLGLEDKVSCPRANELK